MIEFLKTLNNFLDILSDPKHEEVLRGLAKVANELEDEDVSDSDE